jgi:hypothetical protein
MFRLSKCKVGLSILSEDSVFPMPSFKVVLKSDITSSSSRSTYEDSNRNSSENLCACQKNHMVGYMEDSVLRGSKGNDKVEEEEKTNYSKDDVEMFDNSIKEKENLNSKN